MLLATLPDEDQRHVARRAEIVPLHKGQVVCEAGRPLDHAYFPMRGLVSLQKLAVDGASVELASVSRHGMVGVPLVLGARRASYTARVQVQGAAVRVRTHVLEALLSECPAVRSHLLAYANDLIEEIGQGLHCHSLHPGLQRLCRWLLVTAERLDDQVVPLTHDALGQVLGMPRTGVTRLVTELQEAGAIRCRYGRITILNRRRLELSACDCNSREPAGLPDR